MSEQSKLKTLTRLYIPIAKEKEVVEPIAYPKKRLSRRQHSGDTSNCIAGTNLSQKSRPLDMFRSIDLLLQDLL
jgi:hypothetical protein